MTSRRPNPRLVKVHRSYTVEEAARTLGIHKNTVRAWIKQGLATIDNRRPVMIYGADLRKFLEVRQSRRRVKLKSGQLYCCRCRAAREPAGNIADYFPISDSTGNLQAICPDCNTLINRIISQASMEALRGNLEVSFPQG